MTISLVAEEPWSIDSKHPITNEVYGLTSNLRGYNSKKKSEVMLQGISQNFFRFYQKYISPLDGSSCYFTPTCSRYAASVIERYGVIKGGIMSADRLLRCHAGQVEPRYDPPVDLEKFKK